MLLWLRQPTSILTNRERLQGTSRLNRAKTYFNYLGVYFGQEVYRNHSLIIVDGAGHNS